MQGGAQGQKPGSGRGRGRDREGENALGRAWEEMEKSTRQMQESLRGQVQGWTGLLLGRALHTGLLGPHTHSGASSLFHRVLSSLRTGLQVSALLRCPSYTVVGPEEILAA